MSIKIKKNFGFGGRNMSATQGEPNLAEAIRALNDEITELRAQYAAQNAKLDADAGVTDTDYASSLALADRVIENG